MPRQKGKKNTPQEIINEIIRLHTIEGFSIRELSKRYEMPFKTVKNMFTRENNKKKRINQGETNHKLGRPRTRPFTTEEELKIQIKQLKREVDLYRSFLQVAGRM